MNNSMQINFCIPIVPNRKSAGCGGYPAPGALLDETIYSSIGGSQSFRKNLNDITVVVIL